MVTTAPCLPPLSPRAPCTAGAAPALGARSSGAGGPGSGRPQAGRTALGLEHQILVEGGGRPSPPAFPRRGHTLPTCCRSVVGLVRSQVQRAGGAPRRG